MDEFYQYMSTITIFNSWDTSSFAMNGLDHDGDCVINTNMPVIVRNTRELPAIICVQRKAPKCVPTEQDLMLSNLKSFGSAVGSITNKITNMFEVQSRFPPGSREYNLLNYRIKCGQLYQQNAIDKTKGIDSQPMPDSWFNWILNSIQKKEKAGNSISLSSKEKKNRFILANKKPYFMRYIYPAEDAKYRKYEKDTDNKCKMKFGISLKDLETKENKTPEENLFLDYYYTNIPPGTRPLRYEPDLPENRIAF